MREINKRDYSKVEKALEIGESEGCQELFHILKRSKFNRSQLNRFIDLFSEKRLTLDCIEILRQMDGLNE